MTIVLKYGYKHARVSYVMPGGRNCQQHQYSIECPVCVVSLALAIKPVKLSNDISI